VLYLLYAIGSRCSQYLLSLCGLLLLYLVIVGISPAPSWPHRRNIEHLIELRAHHHDSMELMTSSGTMRRKAHAEGMRERVSAFEVGREDRGVSTMPPLPPTGGKNMPYMPEADSDSAAPTAPTEVVVYKIWESHLRAVGVAAIAGIAVGLLHLFLRPTVNVVVSLCWLSRKVDRLGWMCLNCSALDGADESRACRA
jgi:hypothetical protein